MSNGDIMENLKEAMDLIDKELYTDAYFLLMNLIDNLGE